MIVRRARAQSQARGRPQAAHRASCSRWPASTRSRAAIRTILFHPGFPVDIRHNAKIFREQLAVWAAGKIKPDVIRQYRRAEIDDPERSHA